MSDKPEETGALLARLRELESHELRYQYAMEASNDGLWDWHLGSGKIYFSHSFLRLLGYGYEDLPGNLDTLKQYFVHPDDLDNLLQEFAVAVANRRSSLQLQYRMLKRDGAVIWVHSRAGFFEHDSSGQATRCVVVNSDITRFILTQQELLHAKAQADRASNIKSEFLARVSHELRTPMNAIIGLGYLLRDTALDEQQQSYLTSIHSAADSLLQIINQLLDFSKIEVGRVILEQAHFDLQQLFEKLTRLFEISALHRPVSITYDLAPEVPRFVRGDAGRLGQVLNHLLNNAFLHAGCDQVVVRVRRLLLPGLVLEFVVEDAGCGMSAEQLQCLEARLCSHQEPGAAGGGGLAICQHLVGLMGGEMHVAAAPGGGCRVSFSARFEPSRLGDNKLREQSRSLGNIRVLVVDDNRIARTILMSTVRSLKLVVDESNHPLAALDKIRAADSQGYPYHLVLLDYRMPSVNGLQLTGMIKNDLSLRYMPQVFLISAYQRDEISHTDANALRVDEFLSKPVSESRLFEAVTRAINREPRLQAICPLLQAGAERFALLHQARVLVVEDNLVNQQVICGILKKQQVQTWVAGNGLEALELLANEPFDAVLMDLEMPVMDGLEATLKIRERWSAGELPILAVTAQAMRGDRERCLAAGMNGYLSKPVNPELLYTSLAEVLSQPSEHPSNSAD